MRSAPDLAPVQPNARGDDVLRQIDNTGVELAAVEGDVAGFVVIAQVGWVTEAQARNLEARYGGSPALGDDVQTLEGRQGCLEALGIGREIDLPRDDGDF